jgi:flagellar basal body rod protein FlgG
MLLHGDINTTIIVFDRKNFTMTNLAKSTSSTLGDSIKISAVVAACVAFSACGAIAEKVTEEGAERIIEAESGENVDLDFNSGDGSFSVKTEDGSFSVNENGEFVVTDADGSVFSGSASDDGVVVVDDNGNPVLNVSGDGDSGEISIQGENGEDVYRVVTDVPDEWPSDIPRPEALTVDAGSYASADGETLMTLIGAPDNGDAVEYTENYSKALLAAGLTETGRFDSSANGTTNAQRTYESDRWVVNVSGYFDDSTNAISISVVSKSS